LLLFRLTFIIQKERDIYNMMNKLYRTVRQHQISDTPNYISEKIKILNFVWNTTERAPSNYMIRLTASKTIYPFCFSISMKNSPRKFSENLCLSKVSYKNSNKSVFREFACNLLCKKYEGLFLLSTEEKKIAHHFLKPFRIKQINPLTIMGHTLSHLFFSRKKMFSLHYLSYYTFLSLLLWYRFFSNILCSCCYGTMTSWFFSSPLIFYFSRIFSFSIGFIYIFPFSLTNLSCFWICKACYFFILLL